MSTIAVDTLALSPTSKFSDVKNITWPVIDQRRSTVHPLLRLLLVIYYLPIPWRKWIIALCRVQQDPYVNAYLLQEFRSIEKQHSILTLGQDTDIVTLAYIRDLCRNFYSSPTELSLVSYVCRAEKFADLSSALKIEEETLLKELHAALYFRPHTGQLNYEALFESDQPESPYEPALQPVVGEGRVGWLFRAGARSLSSTMSRFDAPLIYPFYNGTKNMGYTTQEALHRDMAGGYI